HSNCCMAVAHSPYPLLEGVALERFDDMRRDPLQVGFCIADQFIEIRPHIAGKPRVPGAPKLGRARPRFRPKTLPNRFRLIVQIVQAIRAATFIAKIVDSITICSLVAIRGLSTAAVAVVHGHSHLSCPNNLRALSVRRSANAVRPPTAKVATARKSSRSWAI